VRNTLILLGLVSLLSTGSIFAQDEDAVKRHTIEIFMEGDSGTLVNNTTGIFAGNDVELGLLYRYTVLPYFSVYVKSALIGGVNWVNQNWNPNPNVYEPEYKLNGSNGVFGGVGYLEFGMTFGAYGYLALRADLMIKAYGFVPLNINDQHGFTILAGVEAYPMFFGNKKLGTSDVDGLAKDHSIKVIAVGFNYKTAFAQKWGFITELQYRTGGQGDGDASGGSTWKLDSMEALKINSSFRWDNTITFNPTVDSSIWFQVRYLASYFVKNDSAKRAGGAMNDVYLRFGFTKAFNF